VHKLGHCRSVVKYLLFLYCLQDIMSVCGVGRGHDKQNLLRICKKGNTTGTTSGTVTAYPSNVHEFIRGSSGIRGARSLVFCVVFYGSFLVFCLISLAVLLSSLLRFTALIAPLVSSKFSCTHCTKLSSWSPNVMLVYILIALLILNKEVNSIK